MLSALFQVTNTSDFDTDIDDVADWLNDIHLVLCDKSELVCDCFQKVILGVVIFISTFFSCP